MSLIGAGEMWLEEERQTYDIIFSSDIFLALGGPNRKPGETDRLSGFRVMA